MTSEIWFTFSCSVPRALWVRQLTKFKRIALNETFPPFRMKDIALLSEGTHVYFASCHDDKYPLENIIDGKWDTFWPTSGLFPHSFIVTFRSLMRVDNFNMQSYNVKVVQIEKSVEEDPISFNRILEKELEFEDRKMQTIEYREAIEATHLRFIIVSGYDHFVSINNLQIMADPIEGHIRPVVTFDQDFITHDIDDEITFNKIDE